MESIPDWAILIGNIGFPAIITIYLLTRFEKRIDDLTKAIHNLQSKINS